MDFFGHQEVARKKTGLLVSYFVLAVILIIAAIYIALSILFLYYGVPEGTPRPSLSLENIWNPELAITVSISILLVVLLGSLYKTAQLSSGGKAVAEMLGGQLIKASTKDLNERKILNVVEEMAIASGTPVPPVYLLDEEGINAFAAGFKPDDAVIGVTRGCIQQLSRNELQGVIAHEFSHILNGDMRLNIRLTGVLHGILVIAMIGYFLLRSSAASRGSSDKKGGAAAFALLGLIVMIVGYIGVFFGKLIKSAVSRQREFLADASAVQFTRDPSGIGGALKKIGGFIGGSRLVAAGAEQASHFFFADGLAQAWFNLMATHPPIEERIRRIDGTRIESVKGPGEVKKEAAPTEMASGFISGVGTLSQIQIRNAERVFSALAEEIKEGLQTTAGARAILIGLLISKIPEVRKKQLLSVEKWPGIRETYAALSIPLGKIEPRSRLPLVELAVRTLKEMDAKEFADFMAKVDELVNADDQTDIFEYSLKRMVERRLSPTFKKSGNPTSTMTSPRMIKQHLSLILAILAVAGTSDRSLRISAYKKGWTRFQKSEVMVEMPVLDSWTTRLDTALDSLSNTTFPMRKEILDACVECAFYDKRVTVEESELLRIFADALGCPVPPVLD